MDVEVVASRYIDQDGQAIQVILRDITERIQLRHALERANTDLQTANAALQTANEELQATNEELQAATGELRTSNDTLERRVEARTADLSQARFLGR